MQTHYFRRFNQSEIRTRHLALIKFIILALAILICSAIDSSAQKAKSKEKIPSKNESAESISVVNFSTSDYLSGESNVSVNPKKPTVVRLGLAQNAVSIVEFPAADGVYYIHEGNPKMVSVFQSPTRETDRSITIYPGEGFLSGVKKGETELSATITLQMRSGLILILEFVPVREVRKSAHRCVISYKRDEVVAARRFAGLAVDLGEETKPPDVKDDVKNDNGNSSDVEPILRNEPNDKKVESETIQVADSEKEETQNETESSKAVSNRLAECIRNPTKYLGSWSTSTNNLSLSVSRVTEIDAEKRLVIIAVRNDSVLSLRLLPEMPEVQLTTSDKKGNIVQTERIEREIAESTTSEGVLSPGSTVYFAIVYKSPVMSSNQALKVSVGHRESADTPATIGISSRKKRKEN
jgi:hypothetical protein